MAMPASNQENTATVVIMKPKARRRVSIKRGTATLRKVIGPPVLHATIAGTKIIEEHVFEKRRSLQTSQYPCVPQPFSITNPASRNDDRSGAIRAPNKKKTLIFRKLSKRMGALEKIRVAPAPKMASKQLLINQQRTMAQGTPLPISTAICAGKAVSSNSHHLRTGINRNPARRMELGNHITETGWG